MPATFEVAGSGAQAKVAAAHHHHLARLLCRRAAAHHGDQRRRQQRQRNKQRRASTQIEHWDKRPAEAREAARERANERTSERKTQKRRTLCLSLYAWPHPFVCVPARAVCECECVHLSTMFPFKPCLLRWIDKCSRRQDVSDSRASECAPLPFSHSLILSPPPPPPANPGRRRSGPLYRGASVSVRGDHVRLHSVEREAGKLASRRPHLRRRPMRSSARNQA